MWLLCCFLQVVIKSLCTFKVKLLRTLFYFKNLPVYCFLIFWWYCGHVQIHVALISVEKTVIIRDESSCCTLYPGTITCLTKRRTYSRRKCVWHRWSPVGCCMSERVTWGKNPDLAPEFIRKYGFNWVLGHPRHLIVYNTLNTVALTIHNA